MRMLHFIIAFHLISLLTIVRNANGLTKEGFDVPVDRQKRDEDYSDEESASVMTEELLSTDSEQQQQELSTPASMPYCDPLHFLFAGFILNHGICDHYCGATTKYGRGSCRIGRCICSGKSG